MQGVGLYTDDTTKFSEAFIANYANINIIPEIKRIPGVGSASIFGGGKEYSMRIWLRPAQMETYHITPAEVIAAIQDKNLESAPGRFGETSKEVFEYVIKYKGKLTKPEEYANIAIRANNDGSILRLKDVARVEFGLFSYNSITHLNGKRGVGIPVVQLAGSNSNQIQIAINELLEKDSKKFPAGMKYVVFYNTKDALDESISQVEQTLFEAFILVFIVVFIFLQDFRSTLIPAFAVPVAIIATFFFMQLFGFTINLLTLFALVLAIGIVVDDAIVVVEAVHAKMENEGLEAGEATKSAMKEITGAIISITLVMSAVFLPVGFIEGAAGVFFRQFAFTMAIAIVISALNALTLSPALCALFLKNEHKGQANDRKLTFKEKFFTGFNTGFSALTSRYVGGLKFLIRHKWLTMGLLALITVGTVILVKRTPTGFIPTEDQGFIAIAAATPSGTSLTRTNEIMKIAEDKLQKMPSNQYVAAVSGYNILTSSTNPSTGVMFFQLKPRKKRGEIQDIDANVTAVRNVLSGIDGASFFVFTFPTIPGFSNVEAIDLVLQDKTSSTLAKFSGITNTFIADLMKQKEIAVAFTSFKADYPQYLLEIDNDKADQLGISVRDALATFQGYFGTAQASDFNRFGKYYKVIVQADIADRASESSIDRVFVKNKQGNMVPISSIAKLTRVYGSETASRYNLFNSIEINVIPKPGFSSGDAIAAINRLAAQRLPEGFSYEFTGQTREEIASGGQSYIIFILSLVFVYFLLCAQYESYILPLAVLLSIPCGIFGVFLSIGYKGIENNIYVQVALITLIGLMAKNGILIVEFAVQRRRAGKALVESAIKAAKLRIRPILMTSFAFIFGLFPMSIATGPSAQGNHSISFAAAGGMISAVFLGLFFIPVLFIIFQGLQEKISGQPTLVPDAATGTPLKLQS